MNLRRLGCAALLSGLWACGSGDRERYTLRTPPTTATESGTERTARVPASAASVTLPAGSRYFERNGQLAPSSAPGAERALSSAIWAELVSGAANARALYWEDGALAFAASR